MLMLNLNLTVKKRSSSVSVSEHTAHSLLRIFVKNKEMFLFFEHFPCLALLCGWEEQRGVKIPFGFQNVIFFLYCIQANSTNLKEWLKFFGTGLRDCRSTLVR